MSKRSSSIGPEAKEKDPKVVIYSRIDPSAVAELDAIADDMRPKPSRSQLIDAAVAEYVERHKKFAKPTRD
jgi:metal-responsive CopG/Arc/MetJ family transcriptional regulator